MNYKLQHDENAELVLHLPPDCVRPVAHDPSPPSLSSRCAAVASGSRSPLGCPYYKTSSGESHELEAESRVILRGLMTPRDPLSERSRSYEEFIQLAEMKLEVSGAE